jgi:P-type E1-E2 ATPase
LIYVGKIRSILPQWVPPQKGLYVGVESDNQLIGVIHCSDPIRLEAEVCLSELREEGVSRIVLVTGDTDEGSKEIMSTLPISEPYYSLTPEGKLAIVEAEMKKTKGSVVLIGDGINDSPALATADVGIAMGGSGATAASEAADIVIVEPSLTRVVAVLKIAKLTVRRAIQAAILGMGLSTIGMIFAANGIIKASEGAFLQEGIDLLSILWALTVLVAYRGSRFDQSTFSKR